MRHVEMLLAKLVGQSISVSTIGQDLVGRLLYVGTGYIVLDTEGSEFYVMMDKIISIKKL